MNHESKPPALDRPSRHLALLLVAGAGIWSLAAILISVFQSIPLLVALSRPGADVHHGVIVHLASSWQIWWNLGPLLLFVPGVSISQRLPRGLVLSCGLLVILFFLEPVLLKNAIQHRVQQLQDSAVLDAGGAP